MKTKFTKYFCDICGKEVPRKDYYKGRITTRYIVKLNYDYYYIAESDDKPTKKRKVDVCGQCYKNMTDWIRSKTEES